MPGSPVLHPNKLDHRPVFRVNSPGLSTVLSTSVVENPWVALAPRSIAFEENRELSLDYALLAKDDVILHDLLSIGYKVQDDWFTVFHVVSWDVGFFTYVVQQPKAGVYDLLELISEKLAGECQSGGGWKLSDVL
jgi:hypothetical protein